MKYGKRFSNKVLSFDFSILKIKKKKLKESLKFLKQKLMES